MRVLRRYAVVQVRALGADHTGVRRAADPGTEVGR